MDGERVGIMGFSVGAAAALATVARFRDTPAPAAGFRVAVLFYPPGCSPRIERAEAPLLLLIGSLDGGAPTCLDMSQRVQGRGAPVTMVVYPNAYHAFDDARATSTVGGQGAAGVMMVRSDPHATANARVRIRAFLAEHLRGSR